MLRIRFFEMKQKGKQKRCMGSKKPAGILFFGWFICLWIILLAAQLLIQQAMEHPCFLGVQADTGCNAGRDLLRLLPQRPAPLGQTKRGFFICCYRYSTLHLLYESAQTLLDALQLLPVAVRLCVCHHSAHYMSFIDSPLYEMFRDFNCGFFVRKACALNSRPFRSIRAASRLIS